MEWEERKKETQRTVKEIVKDLEKLRSYEELLGYFEVAKESILRDFHR